MTHLRKSAALLMIVLLFLTAQPAVFATGNVTGSETAGRTTGPVFTDVDETVYATTAVNVRTGPSTDYTILNCLVLGQSVRRIGIGDNGWSKVIYNGAEAYVFSAYLSTTRPIVTETNTDYSKLTRQIAIANGLTQADYTGASWEPLADALAAANKAMNSKDQEKVDECEQTLSAAIASLVKMDYSALVDALAAVREFIGSDEQNGLWTDLVNAANNGQAQLNSGDQAAVDAAAAQINEILEKVKAGMENQTPPEVITQEVYIEVPPSDDYCNIAVHHVWPVLLIVSVVFNLVLVALIVVYVSRKRRNQTDDIPLVDYEIDDDLV